VFWGFDAVVFDEHLLVFMGRGQHIRQVLETTLHNLQLFAFNVVVAVQSRQFHLL
jgi:hypothetical protein